jgi:hypothetical protein
VSSICFLLYYTCSDTLLAIALPLALSIFISPLTVTFPKLSVILRPLYGDVLQSVSQRDFYTTRASRNAAIALCQKLLYFTCGSKLILIATGLLLPVFIERNGIEFHCMKFNERK